MKTWMFWVIILVFVFVVVPLIYFGIIAKNVANVAASDKSGWSYKDPSSNDTTVHMTK